MNEQEFARRVAAHLAVAAHEVDDATAARLRAARLRALAPQQPRAGWFARHAAWLRACLSSRLALNQALAVCAVLALVVVGDYWRTSSMLAEVEEIDSALLSDELPIDAYLDQDFGAWLRHVSDDS